MIHPDPLLVAHALVLAAMAKPLPPGPAAPKDATGIPRRDRFSAALPESAALSDEVTK